MPFSRMSFSRSTCWRATILAGFVGAIFLFVQFAVAGESLPRLGPEDIYRIDSPSICTLVGRDVAGQITQSGSGFVSGQFGLITTNAHVVSGVHTVSVSCGDKHGDIESVVAFRDGVDLIILQSSLKDIQPLVIRGVELPVVGESLFAIGSPLGLEGSLTPGLVSGVREIDGLTYLQISASINPGSSGGPVVDSSGAVIGIATMYVPGMQSLNFAIRADLLKTLPVVKIAFSDFAKRVQSTVGEGVSSEPGSFSVAPTSLLFGVHKFLVPCDDDKQPHAIGTNPRMAFDSVDPAGVGYPEDIAKELSLPTADIAEILGVTEISSTKAFAMRACHKSAGLILGRYEMHATASELERVRSLMAEKYGLPKTKRGFHLPQIVDALALDEVRPYLARMAHEWHWEVSEGGSIELRYTEPLKRNPIVSDYDFKLATFSGFRIDPEMCTLTITYSYPAVISKLSKAAREAARNGAL